MDISFDKTIDWGQCLELTNGKESLSLELLTMFVDNLDKERQSLNEAMASGDLANLSAKAHKLHGACCYAGVPKLKNLVRNLEQAAKDNDKEDCQALYHNILEEMTNVENLLASGDYR